MTDRRPDDRRASRAPEGRRRSVKLTAIITAVIALGLYALIILQHV